MIDTKPEPLIYDTHPKKQISFVSFHQFFENLYLIIRYNILQTLFYNICVIYSFKYCPNKNRMFTIKQWKLLTNVFFRGNRVMGTTVNAGLSNLLLVDKHLIYPVPNDWTLEEAATVPVAYTTAIYALIMVIPTEI